MNEIRSPRSAKVEVPHLLAAFVLLSLLATTLPGLIGGIRSAWRLLPLGVQERRTQIMGPLYPSIIRVRTQLPPGDEPVALVLRRHSDADAGVYVNHFLYPRPTRLYDGAAAYANDPHHPRLAVWIDRSLSEEARLVPPSEILRHAAESR
jgi:hypothetical protein